MNISSQTVDATKPDPFQPKHTAKTFEGSALDGRVVVHGVIDGYGAGTKDVEQLRQGMHKFLERWFKKDG